MHFTVLNDSHIHHITTVQQFIEDDVLHQMCLLQLAVIQPCVSKTDIYRVVFLDVRVILVALDIITSGFVEQECLFQIADILCNCVIRYLDFADTSQRIGDTCRIGKGTDG